MRCEEGKEIKKYYLYSFVSIIILCFFLSCGGGGSSSGSGSSSKVSVTVGGNGNSASLKIEKDTLFARARIFFNRILKSNEAIAAIPSSVSKIVFTISAPDITTITRPVVVSGQTSITETFTVANGSNRYFKVEAFDSAGKLLYLGETYTALSGGDLALNINMSYVRVTLLVANSGNNTVSVIDTLSNSVISTIPAGQEPWGVGVNPVTRLAYVTNRTGGTVSVIDIVTNTIVNTISMPNPQPTGVAVDKVTNKVFISNSYTFNGIDVINAAAGNSLSSVTFGGAYALGIAVNPDIGRVYSNDWGELFMIDAVSNSLVAPSLVVGGDTSPFGLAVNPLTNRVYLTELTSTGVVYVIDGISNTLITTVNVGMDPEGIAIHKNANKAYVANFASSNISVIDLTTNSVVSTITGGSGPAGVVVNPADNKAYVTNYTSGNVSVIDTTTDTVIATITVGPNPKGIAISHY